MTNEELQEYSEYLTLHLQTETVTINVRQFTFLSNEELGLFVRHIASINNSVSYDLDTVLSNIGQGELAQVHSCLLALEAGGVLTTEGNLSAKLTPDRKKVAKANVADDIITAERHAALVIKFNKIDATEELKIFYRWCLGKRIPPTNTLATNWLRQRSKGTDIELANQPLFCSFCAGTGKVVGVNNLGAKVEADCTCQDEKEKDDKPKLEASVEPEPLVTVPGPDFENTGTDIKPAPASKPIFSYDDFRNYQQYGTDRNGSKTGDDVVAGRVRERLLEPDKIYAIPEPNADVSLVNPWEGNDRFNDNFGKGVEW